MSSTFDIRAFGAQGDGATLDSEAVNRAIAACHAAGGGTVLVPAGTYRCGTIELLSRVNLHLAAGAVLQGSPCLADYRILPWASEGRNTALLYAYAAEGIAIDGHGTIDGNGRSFAIPGAADTYRDFGAEHTRQGADYCLVNDLPDEGPVRFHPRPGILALFLRCRGISVTQVSVVDAPNWCLHAACSDGLLFSQLTVRSSLILPNSDGIDVGLCQNVRISDCDIEAGDDAIAIACCADGFGSAPCRHVVVQNCILSSRSAAIRVGWSAHDIGDLAFSNIVIRNSNRGIGLFARAGGSITNVTFANILIETRLHPGKWWGKAEPVHLSALPEFEDQAWAGAIRQVRFHGVRAACEHGIVLWAADRAAIEDVTFDDVQLEFRSGPLQRSFGGNVDLRPVADPRWQVFRHDIPAVLAEGVKGLRLRHVEARWSGEFPAFFLQDAT